MTKTRRWIAHSLVVTVIVILGAGPTAASEEVPLVDGEMWQATATPLKRAYLIGIANFLTTEYVFQKKNGFPPDSQSSTRVVYEGIDDVTLDQSIERIDGWYQKNPDKNDTTVLEVIWLDMVEPNLR
jgi:hypothetical protein